MTEKKQRLVKIILPIVVIVIGAAIAAWLIAAAPQAEKADQQQPGVLVETTTVSSRQHTLQVQAQGNVIAARQIQVQPQVSGKVLSVHPNLAPGGIVDAGEHLVQIDPTDYELAVATRTTAMQEAQAQLSLELGRQEVAEQEWEMFERQFEDVEQEPELALREPQLKAAQAQVDRAKADLQQAQLQLQRTTITAPFRALVVDESVDRGQQVQPQQALATLVDASEFWVRVALPPDQVHVIDIPDGSGEGGASAEVALDLGNAQHHFRGRVLRMQASLDSSSRMVPLIVSVKNPLSALQNPTADFPLLLNAYVEVTIAGNQHVEAIAVPRQALRNGDEVYTYADGKLRINKVELAWERPEEVLISAGLEPGAEIVTSNIAAPVDGMRLRLEGEEPGSNEAADD